MRAAQLAGGSSPERVAGAHVPVAEAGPLLVVEDLLDDVGVRAEEGPVVDPAGGEAGEDLLDRLLDVDQPLQELVAAAVGGQLPDQRRAQVRGRVVVEVAVAVDDADHLAVHEHVQVELGVQRGRHAGRLRHAAAAEAAGVGQHHLALHREVVALEGEDLDGDLEVLDAEVGQVGPDDDRGQGLGALVGGAAHRVGLDGVGVLLGALVAVLVADARENRVGFVVLLLVVGAGGKCSLDLGHVELPIGGRGVNWRTHNVSRIEVTYE